MKFKLFLATGLLLLGTVAFTSYDSLKTKKMLRHVVLFKFKDSSTPQQVKEVEDAFRKLPSQIKEIKSLEWGTNNSPENLNQGFTHCFFVTFEDEAGRAVYLPHPAHKAFGKVLGPHLDKVLVVDYWVQE
nr:Dabb family protein [Telluribacter sp. SYSU D00476]